MATEEDAPTIDAAFDAAIAKIGDESTPLTGDNYRVSIVVVCEEEDCDEKYHPVLVAISTRNEEHSSREIILEALRTMRRICVDNGLDKKLRGTEMRLLVECVDAQARGPLH